MNTINIYVLHRNLQSTVQGAVGAAQEAVDALAGRLVVVVHSLSHTNTHTHTSATGAAL